ncbi:dienelactone hydrolase family protein [Rhodoferax mekongensis]|uniref:Dienelactone hydrolase family protein n=1 Tax=Rhodoferax mekongensis TaxID=3068341 RepID=A0ABZ0AZD7_9BURK|nr:dienelactone hydrolase family protein [Rhodoferax sp. TBRC 17307]WNO04840.1 dienelactone hydrolase family protein [Rhodoferax sp. TBRC 17307]
MSAWGGPVRNIVVGAWAVWVGLCSAMAAPVTQEVSFASQEAGVTLKAYWTAPAGSAKAPAVVALHGCGGLPQDRTTLNYAQSRYIRIFHDAGMGVLYLDSFGPRGFHSICEQKPTERTLTEANRRQDVLAALQWLATQPEVDASKMAVVGWSHGGQTVLATADRNADGVAQARIKPAALVAFYPGCNVFEKQWAYSVVAPLLVMSGELDNWTPAATCKSRTDRLTAAKQPVRYVQYPGSYHAFDSATPVVERDNVGGTKSGKAMVGGNPEARVASAREMLQFLSRELAFPVDLAVLDDNVHAAPVPAPSGFAALANVDALPRMSEKGKTLYREWLEKSFPRAVALSDKGAIARGYGRTAMETAIKNCEKFGNPCRLYAVDDQVVWTNP